MDKGTLYIDGQVFQSEAWDRGMGKYSLSLLQHISANGDQGYRNVYIVLSSNLELNKEAKVAIQNSYPSAELLFIDLVSPEDPSTSNIPAIQKINKEILNKAIASTVDNQDEEITFLILALFIGESCSVFPDIGKKVLLFYDLIPLQYSERYGRLPNYKNYLAKFNTIFEADLILTISQTVADDVVLNLGINSERVVNIDGAAIKRSNKRSRKPKINNLPKKYILMPSGNELRKNNKNAVMGFEKYRNGYSETDLSLVITSTFDEVTRSELSKLSDNLVFSGNVAEEELHWLYENSEALLFVPEYEGLGLPILEALEVNLPVVCSNISVFNEMSTDAFYYAEPLDPNSISEAIGAALSKSEFDQKHKEYSSVLKRYTWDNSAKRALEAIGQMKPEEVVENKLKLAIFAPTPAGYSAIGKVVLLMHAQMSRYFDIDYYVEEGSSIREFSRPNYLPFIANVVSAKKFNRALYKKYDAVVYHVGNSEFHLETIKNSLYLPGYAIVHDSHLANIFTTDLLRLGYISDDRLLAEKKLDEKIKNEKANYITSILNNQIGIIVHSAFQKDGIEKNIFNEGVECSLLNIPVSTPSQTLTNRLDSLVTIGMAGIIDPAKGLDTVEKLAKDPEFLDTKIVIFGIPLVSEDVIQRLRSYPNVEVHTNLTDFQFQNLLSRLDILISFRPDERGYPSLATIEAMRYGVVPIVKKLGWYDELPDNTVVKVRSESELAAELRELIDDPARREEIQVNAQEFMRYTHSYAKYAEQLFEVISTSDKNTSPASISKLLKAGASKDKIRKYISEK